MNLLRQPEVQPASLIGQSIRGGQIGHVPTQANLKHDTSRLLPIIGELVRANARHLQIIAVFEKVSQTFGDGKFLRR